MTHVLIHARAQARPNNWRYVADALRWLNEVALPVALIVSLAFLAVSCSPLPRVDVQQPTTAKATPPVRVAVANGAIFQSVGYLPALVNHG